MFASVDHFNSVTYQRWTSFILQKIFYFILSFHQRDLVAVEEKVNTIASEAGDLVDKFPDAFQLISNHNNIIVESWNQLLEKSLQRKEQLTEAEKMQLYLNDFRDLM